MLTQDGNTTAEFAVALLIHYSFDLGGCTASELIDHWLKDYSANWVRSAVIEALYQGRYKAISVEQILAFWKRRGLALYRFNHEFERLICSNLPQTLAGHPDITADPVTSELDKASFSNGHDGSAVVTASGAGEKMAVKDVDPSANVPHAGNSFGKELTPRSHQTSDNKQQSGRRSPPQISPSIANHLPIEHFTPETSDKSDFYTKLKAIAQRPEDDQLSD